MLSFLSFPIINRNVTHFINDTKLPGFIKMNKEESLILFLKPLFPLQCYKYEKSATSKVGTY